MLESASKDYCMKTAQILSFSWFVLLCIRTKYGDLRTNRGKYGPEKNPYLDNFHVVDGEGFDKIVLN